MKDKLKSKLNIFIIFVVTFIVLYFSLKDDFSTILNQIINIDKKFLLLGVALVFAYYYLRSIVLNNFINKFSKKFSFKKTFGLTLKTQFFNGVTPFATGGQPFQVIMLKKDGIKLSHATNIIIQDFIVYQIALVLLGIIAVVTNYFTHYFEKVSLLKYLVTLGFIINILVTVLLFVVAFAVKFNKKSGSLIIKVLKKLRIVKDPIKTTKKWQDYVENFHDGALVLLQNKWLFCKGVLYNLMALCALYLVPLVLLYGIGKFNVSSCEAIVTSAYVMIMGSFVPVPGGTGGLEYGFITFYGHFIKGPSLKTTMLLWRFITYYLGVVMGAIVLNFQKKER